eukprot:scaffold45513_cov35-Attheya_sp.AAC.2
MSSAFKSLTTFNEPLCWNVSSDTSMEEGMFYQDIVFNQDVSSWDVSNVIYMGNMFFSDYAFNQYLSSWDVSSVIDMGYICSTMHGHSIKTFLHGMSRVSQT